MLAIEQMAQALPAHQPSGLFAESRICCVTGRETTDAVSAKDVFSDTFGDRDILAAPGSVWVDRRVAEVLGNGHLRWASWVWSERDGWRKADRIEIARIVTGESDPGIPWAAYAAEDMRRHGGLLTRINTTTDDAVIQFGLRGARVDRARPLTLRAVEMLRSGWTKSELLSGAGSARITKVGLAEWMDWESETEGKRGSASFELAIWCAAAIRKEERDAVQADDPS